MMMLDERLFDQEWIQELPADARWLFLYLLAKASRKTGIIELNMRMINFGAATERKYTKEDVLSLFGNRIQLIPGYDDTAIIVDYVATNWAKNGKPIDAVRNPLFKSVVAELERFGLSLESLNNMANKKVNVVKEIEDDNNNNAVAIHPVCGGGKVKLPDTSVSDKDINELFEGFWKSYPGPRKIDKKKCFAKFARILKSSSNGVKVFNDIMNGLDRWMKTDTWMKNGGQFICAPLVWLNNERWNAEIKEGTYNGNQSGNVKTANANFKSPDASGIF